jgi:hypothetical protein
VFAEPSLCRIDVTVAVADDALGGVFTANRHVAGGTFIARF